MAPFYCGQTLHGKVDMDIDDLFDTKEEAEEEEDGELGFGESEKAKELDAGRERLLLLWRIGGKKVVDCFVEWVEEADLDKRENVEILLSTVSFMCSENVDVDEVGMDAVIDAFRVAFKLHRKEVGMVLSIIEKFRKFVDEFKLEGEILVLCFKLFETLCNAVKFESPEFNTALILTLETLLQKFDPRLELPDIIQPLLGLSSNSIFRIRSCLADAVSKRMTLNHNYHVIGRILMEVSVDVMTVRINQSKLSDVWESRCSSLLYLWYRVLREFNDEDGTELQVLLLEMVKSKNIDQKNLARLFCENPRWLSSLPSILHEWTKKIGSWKDFPFTCFNISSENELVELHRDMIISGMVCSTSANFDVVVSKLPLSQEEEVSTVLVNNLPSILCFLLPSCCHGQITGKAVERLEALVNLLGGEKIVVSIVSKRLPEIVAEAIVTVTRKQFFCEWKDARLFDVFSLLDAKIGSALERRSLIRSITASVSIMESMLHIFSIRMGQSTSGSPLYHRLVRALCWIIRFTSPTVLETCSQDLVGYLTWRISYQLSTILCGSKDKSNQAVILSTLTEFFALILEKIPEALSSNAHNRVAYALIHTATISSGDDDIEQMVKKCLDILICQGKSAWIEAIRLLDSFPESSIYSRCRDVMQSVRTTADDDVDAELLRFSKSIHSCGENSEIDTREHGIRNLTALLRNSREKSSKSLSSYAIHSAFTALHRCCSRPAVSEAALSALSALPLFDGTGSIETTILHQNDKEMGDASDPELIKTLNIIIRMSHLVISFDHKVATISRRCLMECLDRRPILEMLDKVEDTKEKMTLLTRLKPFLHKKVKKVSQQQGNVAINSVCDSLSTVLNDDDAWIKGACRSIIENGSVEHTGFECLKDLCDIDKDFCVDLLPIILISTLLRVNTEDRNRLCSCLNSIMESKSISSFKRRNLLEALGYFHAVIQWMRNGHQKVPDQIEESFDHILIGEAALEEGMVFTALLFAEKAYWRKLSRGEAVAESNWQFLIKCYTDLKNLDALHGCQAVFRGSDISRLKVYEEEGRWSAALLWNDILQSEKKTASFSRGTIQALNGLGASNLLNRLTSDRDSSAAEETSNTDLADIQYESAWKLAQWDLLPAFLPKQDSGNAFGRLIYNSLYAARNEEINTAKYFCWESLKRLREQSSQMHYESVHRIKVWHERLKIVGDLSNWLEIGQRDVTSIEQPSLRLALLDIREGEPKRAFLNDALTLCQSLLTSSGENQKCVQLLSRAKLSRSISIMHDTEWRLRFSITEARVCWAREEKDLALNILKEGVDSICRDILPTNENKAKQLNVELLELSIDILTTYSIWLDETQSEMPVSIIKNYIHPAVELYQAHKLCNDEPMAVMASFSHKQFSHLNAYMISPEYEARQNLMNKFREDATDLKALGGNTRTQFILEKEAKIDEVELKQLAADKDRFLLSSIMSYIHCLEKSDKYDGNIFRLIALWLSNLQHEEVCRLMAAAVETIPPHKFLPLIPQLAARLAKNQQPHQSLHFQPALQKLLVKLISWHPYHGSYVILALVHANEDESAASGRLSASRKNTGKSEEQAEERTLGAKDVWTAVKKKASSARKKVFDDIERLARCYIELANANVQKHRDDKGLIRLPTYIQLQKVGELPSVQVPTIELAMDFTGNYQSITHIRSFDHHFQLVGGVNLPKIVFCRCSDGITRRQLVKGRDDLRQDAVMQQVFELVNRILAKDDKARTRSLRIRTYRVLPMSRRSGVLEWCEGTIPIASYLVDEKRGAHVRYRPQDWRPKDCKLRMQRVCQKGTVARLEEYQKITAHFKPVFGHFFLERFRTPALWYQRRLRYTRSLAANSMVGYIIGLGDRHLNNILIDLNSAELIHIDLGVAFDQGRILPTPEMVPFRLTRDLVHGMGALGIEGDFRTSCLITLSKLQREQEVITTVISVLLYDPLYSWSLSPRKVLELQAKRAERMANDTAITTISTCATITSDDDECGDKTNRLAERALLQLKRKFDGYEEGSRLNLSGQVNCLIRKAMHPDMLSKMFYGWQPYL